MNEPRIFIEPNGVLNYQAPPPPALPPPAPPAPKLPAPKPPPPALGQVDRARPAFHVEYASSGGSRDRGRSIQMLGPEQRRARLRAMLDETAGWDDPLPSPARGRIGHQRDVNPVFAKPADTSPPAAADTSLVHGRGASLPGAADVSFRSSGDTSPRAEVVHIHLTLNITNPPIVNNVSIPAQAAPIVKIENKIEPTPVKIENTVTVPAPAVTRDIVITKNSANEWSAVAKPSE
jgi:hypothetical protein